MRCYWLRVYYTFVYAFWFCTRTPSTPPHVLHTFTRLVATFILPTPCSYGCGLHCYAFTIYGYSTADTDTRELGRYTRTRCLYTLPFICARLRHGLLRLPDLRYAQLVDVRVVTGLRLRTPRATPHTRATRLPFGCRFVGLRYAFPGNIHAILCPHAYTVHTPGSRSLVHTRITVDLRSWFAYTVRGYAFSSGPFVTYTVARVCAFGCYRCSCAHTLRSYTVTIDSTPLITVPDLHRAHARSHGCHFVRLPAFTVYSLHGIYALHGCPGFLRLVPRTTGGSVWFCCSSAGRAFRYPQLRLLPQFTHTRLHGYTLVWTFAIAFGHGSRVTLLHTLRWLPRFPHTVLPHTHGLQLVYRYYPVGSRLPRNAHGCWAFVTLITTARCVALPGTHAFTTGGFTRTRSRARCHDFARTHTFGYGLPQLRC